MPATCNFTSRPMTENLSRYSRLTCLPQSRNSDPISYWKKERRPFRPPFTFLKFVLDRVAKVLDRAFTAAIPNPCPGFLDFDQTSLFQDLHVMRDGGLCK